ncbi:MAG: class I SAM-dependent methyltransferase [Pseudomonadota bacterium]
MAFNLGTVEFLVKEMLPRVAVRGRVLSLARQKITCSPEELAHRLESLGFTSGLEQIRAAARVTTRDLFPALGFDRYDDVDIFPEERGIRHDLNEPAPQRLRNRYDLVFEAGTIEHIFDVRMVFRNIIVMLKKGGLVFHLSPLDLINHGFFTFSPTLFYDVYGSNGFAPPDFFLVMFPEKWWKIQEIHYEPLTFSMDLLRPAPPKGFFPCLACLARKEKETGAFRTPLQAFYGDRTGPRKER